MTFEYRRTRRVNKTIEYIALTEDATDAYVLLFEMFICKFSNYFPLISILVYS